MDTNTDHIRAFSNLNNSNIGAMRTKIDECEFKAHVELLFSANPLPTLITHMDDGVIETANPAFFSQIGYTLEEIKGKTIRQINLFSHCSNCQEAIDTLHHNKTFINREIQFRKKSGDMVLMLTSAIEIKIGHEQYILTIGQDITARKVMELSLQQTQERLSHMQRFLHSGLWEIDLSNMHLWASENVYLLYGLDPNKTISVEEVNTVIFPEDNSYRMESLTSLIENDTPYDVTFRIHRKNDGEIRYIHSVATTLKDEKNKPIKVFGELQDITEKKLNETEFTTMIKSAIEGFWLCDLIGRFDKVNDAACKLLGYSRSELINGMSVADISAESNHASILKRIRNIVEAGSERFETKHKCKNGTIIDCEVSATFIPASDRICVFTHDITNRKLHETKISYLSFHDALTGLYNRAFFEEECHRLDTKRQLPLTIIMGDVNGLKLTNDVFGHANGDKLLCIIANIIKNSIRKEDIAARVGGDEFSILLPGADEKVAQRICHLIYSACESTALSLDNSIYHPSVSLGFAIKHESTYPISEVIRNAENLMYKRKLFESKSVHSSLLTNIRTTMFEKSHETLEHVNRLSELARKLGAALGFSLEKLKDLELLSALHDVGKIAVDDHILCKHDPLSQEEWQAIKKHPEIGYRIALASPELISVADGILYHHERWDGSGYPQGLSGNEIPLTARIISVVDAFDAMTHDHIYRNALSLEEARHEIAANAGLQFDPMVTDALLKII